jgi:uncharacterized protein YdeI (BOF family)
MNLSRNPLRLLSTALLLGSVAMSTQAANPARVIPIAQARTLPIGTVVTVEGTITTPSGAFESSFFDKGFGLQDESAGIFISQQTDPGVAPRLRARVTGKLQDASGLLILVPEDRSDLKLRGSAPKVEPEWVRTASVSEATEGRLVRVVGTIVQTPASDLPFGYKFSVDDGSGEAQIFINTQTGIDVSTLKAGRTVSITGFSSQFDTHYEIDPRRPSDIVVRRR